MWYMVKMALTVLTRSLYRQGCDSKTFRGKNIISLGFQQELNKQTGGMILELPAVLGANHLQTMEVGRQEDKELNN